MQLHSTPQHITMIRIKTNKGLRAAPALAVHNGLAVVLMPREAHPNGQNTFSLTHILSGEMVYVGLPWTEIGQADAAMVAALATPSVDWTQPAKKIAETLGKAGVRDLQHRIRLAVNPPRRSRGHWIDITYHRSRRKRMALKPKSRRVRRPAIY